MKDFGLVLGGGGAKAFAHLGVRDALLEEGLEPKIICTSSMGSLIGYLISNKIDTKTVCDEFYKVRTRGSWLRFLLNRNYFEKKTHVDKMLLKLTPERIEESKIPIIINATDLINQKLISFKKGLAIPIIKASFSYPALFKPISLEGKFLIDSGVLNNIPADILKKEKEKRKKYQDIKIISISLESSWDKDPDSYKSRLGLTHKSIYLPLIKQRVEITKKNSDLIIQPFKDEMLSIGSWKGIMQFYSKKKLNEYYEKGYYSTKKKIRSIKKLLKD